MMLLSTSLLLKQTSSGKLPQSDEKTSPKIDNTSHLKDIYDTLSGYSLSLATALHAVQLRKETTCTGGRMHIF